MIDLSLLQDFIAESEEHLEEMETGLLKLEAEPDNQKILNDVFRTAHSIKGSAEYIGAEKTALLSHKLENLLEAIRQGKKVLNDKIIAALMDARDRIAMLIVELGDDNEEKTEIADILKQIEILSADNAETEDVNYTNEDDDEIIELTNVAVEASEDDEFIELSNNIENEVIDLTEIVDDSFDEDITASSHPLFGGDEMETSEDITASSHPLFGDSEMETSEDINITSHPLFGGETEMDSEIESTVIYEDDNDEELFDIFFEHLKENIFSIKGLIKKLHGSDNSSDLLVGCTNAILSLKSSANYMDFTELVNLYEEWISCVEKFQEEMFLADGSDIEDFFKSVKKYLNQIASFFPSRKELCFDFDILQHELIEPEKEIEEKTYGIAVPDDSVDTPVELECEEEEQEQDSVLLESTEEPEEYESEPYLFNEESENEKSETKLSDYNESTPNIAEEETCLTPLSEACLISETLDQGVNEIVPSDENHTVAAQDAFAQDLQSKSGSEQEPGIEPVKQVAD
ncbi:MAG: Hpt domain-containing protein, partial [Desulfosarcina sp.]|nr:Hpt domain-containing protein [Desulfobacterales bacterium]